MNNLIPDFSPLSIIRLFLVTMGLLLFYIYGMQAWGMATDWQSVAGIPL